jgi:DNA-binding NtrC family response regulator
MDFPRRTILLVGRTRSVLDDVRNSLAADNIAVLSSTSLDDVKAAFAEHTPDVVVIGAGMDLESRLAIVRHVFEVSTRTTVHMKDQDSGPEGMGPFVNRVLRGFLTNTP